MLLFFSFFFQNPKIIFSFIFLFVPFCIQFFGLLLFIFLIKCVFFLFLFSISFMFRLISSISTRLFGTIKAYTDCIFYCNKFSKLISNVITNKHIIVKVKEGTFKTDLKKSIKIAHKHE